MPYTSQVFKYPMAVVHDRLHVEQINARCLSKLRLSSGTLGLHGFSVNGIDLLAQDHTGTTVLALRGESAHHFYGEHLRTYGPNEPIVHPYALGENWFQTCLFKLDWTAKVIVNGRTGYVVTQICMVREVIDEFVLYKTRSISPTVTQYRLLYRCQLGTSMAALIWVLICQVVLALPGRPEGVRTHLIISSGALFYGGQLEG